MKLGIVATHKWTVLIAVALLASLIANAVQAHKLKGLKESVKVALDSAVTALNSSLVREDELTYEAGREMVKGVVLDVYYRYLWNRYSYDFRPEKVSCVSETEGVSCSAELIGKRAPRRLNDAQFYSYKELTRAFNDVPR